jgi:hypothetical protein
MTRTVKLTSREPTSAAVRDAVQQTDTAPEDRKIAAGAVHDLPADLTTGVTVAADMVRDWRNLHDAAADDATKALEALLRDVKRLLDNSRDAGVRCVHVEPDDVHQLYLSHTALDEFNGTAALIRQAENDKYN